jgi:hypothetical protein
MNIVHAPLLILTLLAGQDTPRPKIDISKETTYVTGPLDKDGYIDYETALNDRLGKGITPEKNANVLLWTSRLNEISGIDFFIFHRLVACK